MRRGGKSYYALDATDYESPQMIWSLAKGDTDFEEIAQSWSEMNPIQIQYNDGTSVVETTALIFAAGFNGDDDGNGIDQGKDTRNDSDPAFTGTDDDEGNAIYIVDADSGELIWKATGQGIGTTGPTVDSRIYYHADMRDSIPAKVNVANATTPDNIYHDRGYVADTGGRVWRVDFEGTDRSQWKVTVLANLGRHDTTGDQTHDRRFFHPVDIVLSRDDSGDF